MVLWCPLVDEQQTANGIGLSLAEEGTLLVKRSQLEPLRVLHHVPLSVTLIGSM